ncbi:helix-turn-helix domain-containing protein [Pseudomonas sp. NFR16]|uniref:helix-turn-helix domain-containing protein n=1 Tax=Pseudomonas sp. NFR16 TaxID=1566248 RepID=UPI0008B113DD|nr:helix-turn-helix domain-containing protein [Pseudomonas sp. NFR16]SEJ50112.1 Helix-turn-helix domain-containing protein [Pseudomonas sp. NFR16]
MSMDLMVKAMKTKVGHPLRKLVLIKLADNASDQGECWPSYQHIADQCEISRSTVKVHIRELEQVGLLRREFRRKGELNQSNVFHLSLDGGAVDDRGGAGAALPRAESARGDGAESAPRTSHSSEPVKEPKPTGKSDSKEGFSVFWKLYPRKVQKAKAEAAWKKLGVTPEMLAVITAALARQVTSIDWLKSNGQYIPHPTTWLHGRRWEDELQPAAASASRHTGFDQIDYEEGLVLGADGQYRIAGNL